jgi:hypothetical protein
MEGSSGKPRGIREWRKPPEPRLFTPEPESRHGVLRLARSHWVSAFPPAISGTNARLHPEPSAYPTVRSDKSVHGARRPRHLEKPDVRSAILPTIGGLVAFPLLLLV